MDQPVTRVASDCCAEHARAALSPAMSGAVVQPTALPTHPHRVTCCSRTHGLVSELGSRPHRAEGAEFSTRRMRACSACLREECIHVLQVKSYAGLVWSTARSRRMLGERF